MSPGRNQDERDREGFAARRERERDRSRVPRDEFDEPETTTVRHTREIGSFEKSVKRLKWWIGGVAVPAIGAVILVAKLLVAYARESERAAILRELDRDRIAQHEKLLEEISNRLREVEGLARRNEARLLRWRDAPTDPTPDHKVTTP